MNKSLRRDFFRSLMKNPARFLSILLIISLGVGFFAGINATRPDMEKSAHKYFSDMSLMDLRSFNPLGYSEEEIEKIKKIKGIDKLKETYRYDLYLGKGEEKGSLRLFSMDFENFKDEMNKFTLKEGRMPSKENEIVINPGKYKKFPVSIGDEITITAPEGEKIEEYLKNTKYTVVGFIESPLYVSFLRDRTNFGNGTIEIYGYISEKNFTPKEKREIFFTLKGSEDLSPASEEYKNLVNGVKEELITLGKDFMGRETKSLKKELTSKKNDFLKEKEKALSKLNNAQRKIVKGQEDLETGESDYLAKIKKGEEDIKTAQDKIKTSKEELAKGQKEYEDGLKKWEEGNATYLANKKKLDDSKTVLDASKTQLDNAKASLNSAYTELTNGKTQLDAFANGVNKLIEIRNSIPNPMDQASLNNLINQINNYYPDAATYIAQYVNINDPNAPTYVATQIDIGITALTTQYNTNLASYNAGLAKYESGLKEYNTGLSKYNAGLKTYNDGKAKLDAAKTEIDNGKTKLDESKKQLEDGKKQIEDGEKAIETAKTELEQGKIDGRKKLDEGYDEYVKGLSTFLTEKEKALKEIENADEKILKGERDILEIPDKWFVTSREGNPDYFSYFDNAVKIGNVAKVFPMFFFMVAALVSLTTITRMVEEERLQIGTLKALGYSNGSISAKYLIYAFSASSLGSVLGLFIGFNLFPRVIMNAYNLMYNIPSSVVEFNPKLAVISIAIAVLSTVLSAYFALSNEIKENPASLMLPKSPPTGKKIFLEKIGIIWKNLKFSHKVTFRNLFLYKKRFFMTVMGISGCTALILTGFGIKDSVEDMVKFQFKELSIYDEMVITDDKKNPEIRNLDQIFSDFNDIEDYELFASLEVEALLKDSDRSYLANIMVPKNIDKLDKFQILRDRKTKKPLSLPGEGAIINEKLAEILQVKVGDEIVYEDLEKNQFKVKVHALCENYLQNFIYMSPEYYSKIHKLKPDFSRAYVELKKEVDEDSFNKKLLEKDGILTIVSARELNDNFEKQVSSLIFVVLVLILSAGLLAFIVLYNLNNVNITERMRELATIKVLGFRDGEVSAYIYRENLILTFIGAMVGLVLGVSLHKFIMSTLEVDNMMFGKKILPLSYVYSLALTFIFSTIVNFFMHFQLKKIDMVESLKSVE